MKDLKLLLSGGDRRSLGRAAVVRQRIKQKTDVDELFPLIYSSDRVVAMRAIDTLEKITRQSGEHLTSHESELIKYARSASNKEIKWHLAQLFPRLKLNSSQLQAAVLLLNYWISNPNESKIVRANALEAMSEMCRSSNNKRLKVIIRKALRKAERSQIPSIAARARKINRFSEGSI